MWEQTLREKLSELAMISSWAALTGLGRVRDYVRMAESEIKKEIERRATNDAPAAVVSASAGPSKTTPADKKLA